MRLARRWSTITALIAWVGVAPHPASAAPHSTRLVYVRGVDAASCSDEKGIRDAVAVRLGYDPFVAFADATLVVEIKADPAGGFEADIHVVHAGVEAGRRKIRSSTPDCKAAVDALALTLSIIVDPVTALRAIPVPAEPHETPAPRPEPAESHETPAPGPEPARSPAPVPPPAPVAPEPAHPSFVPAVGLALFGSVAEAPAASAGLLVFTRVRRGGFSLGVDLRADLPAGHTSATPAGTVESHTVTGWLVPCVHVSWLEGCALAGAGALFATSNVAAPQSSSAFTWSFGARVGLDVPLGARFFARAFADLVVTPAEAQYYLGGNPSPVYRLPPVGADLGAGVGALFP